jgi:hypothetical protein
VLSAAGRDTTPQINESQKNMSAREATLVSLGSDYGPIGDSHVENLVTT